MKTTYDTLNILDKLDIKTGKKNDLGARRIFLTELLVHLHIKIQDEFRLNVGQAHHLQNIIESAETAALKITRADFRKPRRATKSFRR